MYVLHQFEEVTFAVLPNIHVTQFGVNKIIWEASYNSSAGRWKVD